MKRLVYDAAGGLALIFLLAGAVWAECVAADLPAVRTGIRYTGMPAWNKTLSEQDMWKVTAFLSRIEKLPPAVQDYWKKSTGVAPPAVDPQGEPHGHHD